MQFIQTDNIKCYNDRGTKMQNMKPIKLLRWCSVIIYAAMKEVFVTE